MYMREALFHVYQTLLQLNGVESGITKEKEVNMLQMILLIIYISLILMVIFVERKRPTEALL